MARRDDIERDRSYGGFYGTSSDSGYTHDYDNQHPQHRRDNRQEPESSRYSQSKEYYRDANFESNNYGNRGSYGHDVYRYPDRDRDRDQYNTGPYEEYINYSSRNYGNPDRDNYNYDYDRS